MAFRDELIAALIASKIPSPRLEADIILKHTAPNYPQISSAEEKTARCMLKRRQNHEPLDKILGFREFYKSEFKVTTDVLSPRPDTEILVESALQLIPRTTPFQILDLGTGSGCILLSLLKECQNITGIGVDISTQALAVAKENAEILNVKNRCEFINKSWTQLDFVSEKFDMIVSNPPYIPSEDIKTLEPEVKSYDPLLALDGGTDGFQCYKEIAAIAWQLLKQNGYILLESGQGQAEEIAQIFIASGLTLVKIVPDFAGINRCVILKK